MHNPTVIEEITSAVIQAVLGKDIATKYTQGKLAVSELSAATGKISGFRDMFTARNQEFGNYLSAENQLNAYTLYYLFPNLAKVSAILEYCVRQKWLRIFPDMKIADIGCGPGVGVLGILNYLMPKYLPEEFPALQLTAIDQSAQALKLANRITDSFKIPSLNVKYQTADLENPDTNLFMEKQDVIIMSNVVNELYRQKSDFALKRVNLLKNMLDMYLSEKGLLFIVEPALQKTSRELIAVRDLLLKDSTYTVLAPCTHQNNCPFSDDLHKEDWCHEAHYWHNPALIDQIDKLTGMNKHHIKYSFLIIGRKEHFTIADNLFYVIENPIFSKGCMKVSACGKKGLIELVYTNKSKSDNNRQFKKIEKGSRFYFNNATDLTGSIKVTPEMKIILQDCLE